jgi:ATP phosphoribosyltransferase regulatory subunit
VLHTRPRGLEATREPLQIGAEIYGHAGIESDLEIQNLLLRSLGACGIRGARLDLGHVAVFRALCHRGGVSADLEVQLHEALEAKDVPELEVLAADLDAVTRRALRALPGLYGDATVLARARTALPHHPEILTALDDLTRLSQDNGLPISIDLADLRGYHYHSGVVFSAYAPGLPNAVALGGRYDEVGKAFGRARPATGFSMDLRDLAHVASVAPASADAAGIRAPYGEDAALAAQIERLRGAGEVVIVELPGHEGCDAGGCDRELARVDGQWQVRKLN